MGKEILNEEKENTSFSKVLIVGIIIGGIGLILRISFFPYEIPITLDGLLYFWYGIDAKYIGGIPPGYFFPNNFWPLFLGGIFYLTNFENFLDLMYLQRIFSVMFSVLTFIPVYYLIRKFFDQKYALTGLALFAVEPRLIINSLGGLPESLFVFLGSVTLVLFLNKKMKLIYLSFAICGLFSLVRYEGILLLIPLLITFFVRFKREKKIIVRLTIVITIFLLTVLPMAYLRTEAIGGDGFYSHIVGIGGGGALEVTLSGNQEKVNFDTGVQIFFKSLLWSIFPIFFIFLPYGIFSIIKKEPKNFAIIFTSIIFLIPTLYISVRGVGETKYLLVLFPIFSLLSIFMIQKINEKVNKKNIFLFIVISCAIISSIVFLTYQTDYQHEKEAIVIANEISKRTNTINDYHPESIYLRTVGLADYNDLKDKRNLVYSKIQILFTENYSSLEEFLDFAKNEKLEYIIVDDQENRSDFLKMIFQNEDKYPFLEKDFDSSDYDFNYKVKIFKINYDKFYESFD